MRIQLLLSLLGLLLMLEVMLKPAFCEPTNQPNQDTSQAASSQFQYQSEWIGIGRYMGYEDESITSSKQVLAQFKFIHTLKGPPFAGRMLHVRYNRSSKVEPPPQFQGTVDLSSQVPNRSNWIIFIQYAYSRKGGYDTFKGNKGIIPCTKKNLDDVLDGIERADPHLHFDDSTRRIFYEDAGINLEHEKPNSS